KSRLLSFNHISAISSRVSLRANGNYSKFVSAINNLPVNYAYKLTSSIEQKQAKINLSYALAVNDKIEVGGDYVVYNISPGERKPASPTSNINPLNIQKEKGRELSGFITDEVNLAANITLQAGIRYTSYDYLGPKAVYQYKQNLPLSKETVIDSVSYPANRNIQRYGGFEPRASLKIGITNNMSLKFSYNRGQQFLHLISNTTAISPVDFWKLSDNYIKGQRGDQYAVGYFQNFKNNQYELSLETYFRKIKNMVDYKDGATLLLNPYIESALLDARGRNYGIELSFTRNTGKLTGQINYSYSKSQVQILNQFPSEQVNSGKYFPSNTDRPHNLAIITKLKLGKGWSFNTNFVFSSGRPATYPDGNYAYNGTIVTNYSKRNMDRLPSYHRLDAGFSYVSRRYYQQKKYSILNFSFYNLYLHKNAYSIYFQRSDNVLFSYRLSVVGTIIPSISWTYNF
ncbi:MAG TPA: TonB-dependent receptor, partial [Segetibacter sp.]